jgi:hypothetical protein
MTRMVARPRPALDPGVAAAFVKKCESGHGGRMAALVCGGIPLCFLGPLFITVLVWMQAARLGREVEFWPMFGMVALVGIPILFLIAATVQGSILEAGAGEIDTDTFGGHIMARRAALPMLVLEIGNIGPRMCLHAWRRTSARRLAGRVSVDRVAKAICTLATAHGGISPAKLLLPGEPAEALEPLLGVILFHEMAGISKTGDRVWLATPVREKLGVPHL